MGLEVPYTVSYRVARTGKPHTIVEGLILPAAADMAGTMLWEKAQKTIQTMPPSNNTVSRLISGMFWNNYCFVYKPVNYMCYSWMSQQTWRAWHSSWYMSVTAGWVNRRGGPGTAPGICLLCLWGLIKEDILICKPLETRTTGEGIYKVLDSFVTSNGLWWSICVGVCTDGAKAITGRHSGVVTRVQEVAPDATCVRVL